MVFGRKLVSVELSARRLRIIWEILFLAYLNALGKEPEGVHSGVLRNEIMISHCANIRYT